MSKILLCAVLFCLAAIATAQDLALPGDALAEGKPETLAQAMPALAEQAIATYREPDPGQYLDKLFRLQLVAGKYPQAIDSIRRLRALRAADGPAAGPPLYLQYEVFAKAKIRQQAGGGDFAAAFRQAFAEAFAAFDDRESLQAQWPFGAIVPPMQQALQAALEQQRGKQSIALADAMDLLRKYQVHQAFAAFRPLVDAAIAEDDARRYELATDLLVRTPDGVDLSVMLARPKGARDPLPALLEFTIYANDEWALADAKRGAAHGYASVVAYSRGKGRGTGAIVPYEHDGDDARAVIEWIARQPWSDGRVGMYGGSYNSFAQWAAAKRRPPALKALMTSAAAAPGIDVPMQGNVFMNFVYPWPYYVGNNTSLDDATYDDPTRWDGLNRRWYREGKAYREMDTIDGTPNPVFRRWLDHPGYDAYWQALIPYRDEFAGIDIPVLSTSGYFDGALVGAQYYFNEHTRHNPRADHTLVIGPYEHFTMQTGVPPVVQGYALDPAARIDLQALRFAWFDHVFKGAPKPELLQGRVNYQVMGADTWKHAASLAAMGNASLRLYLRSGKGGEHRLGSDKPATRAAIPQRVDFADRSDADWTAPPLSLTETLDAHHALVFVGEPVAQATEVSGLFSGRLAFVTNKQDLDVTVSLYEKLADGSYLLLSSYMGRASYARDRARRQLLTPGELQHWDFVSERATSRLLQPGSRLVAVLGINKQPDLQVNYGSGKDVSDETLADAGEPMSVAWHEDSYIDVPLWRDATNAAE